MKNTVCQFNSAHVTIGADISLQASGSTMKGKRHMTLAIFFQLVFIPSV